MGRVNIKCCESPRLALDGPGARVELAGADDEPTSVSAGDAPAEVVSFDQSPVQMAGGEEIALTMDAARLFVTSDGDGLAPIDVDTPTLTSYNWSADNSGGVLTVSFFDNVTDGDPCQITLKLTNVSNDRLVMVLPQTSPEQNTPHNTTDTFDGVKYGGALYQIAYFWTSGGESSGGFIDIGTPIQIPDVGEDPTEGTG